MRPPLFKHCEVVPVRYETAERDRLKRMAQGRGISLSSFIRLTSTAQALPSPRLSPVDQETLLELSRWGNNLNQVSHTLNVAREQGSLDGNTVDRAIGKLGAIAENISEIRRKVMS